MSRFENSFNRSNSTSTYSETLAIINNANDINQNNLKSRNQNMSGSSDLVSVSNTGGSATSSANGKSSGYNSCDDLSSLKNKAERPNGRAGNGYVSLIDKINHRIRNNQTWFSLEFFPPKTINGAANLISKYAATTKSTDFTKCSDCPLY